MFKCPCGLAYIGKTSRPLKIRISEHGSTMRNHYQKNPVACHFNLMNHTVASLSYTGIEHVQLSQRGGGRHQHSSFETWTILDLHSRHNVNQGSRWGNGYWLPKPTMRHLDSLCIICHVWSLYCWSLAVNTGPCIGQIIQVFRIFPYLITGHKPNGG